MLCRCGQIANAGKHQTAVDHFRSDAKASKRRSYDALIALVIGL
jgi:hypothetical protein